MDNEYSELMKAVLGLSSPPIGSRWLGATGAGNHSSRPVRKLLKEPGTSATGSITKVERAKRNRLKKLAARARKRNRQ